MIEDNDDLINEDDTNQETITRVSGMFKDWFLDYASYVILERAVPAIEDGFKPVQRRIMHSMKDLDDGRYNKVANIVGHTMQYHPHGDASIADAMVQIGQKDLLIDTQGNWGNVLTGDRDFIYLTALSNLGANSSNPISNLTIDLARAAPVITNLQLNQTNYSEKDRNLNISADIDHQINTTSSFYSTNDTGSLVNGTAISLSGISNKVDFEYTLTATRPTSNILFCINANATL